MRALIIALAALVTREASALPEMTRLGYFACSTCHVSSAGGDVLTPYGRSIAGERLSTWATGGEAKAWIRSPSWLDLGGDYRSVVVDHESAQGTSGLTPIRMQADLAAALVLPHLTITGQGGETGQAGAGADEAAWRSYYAQVDAFGVSARVGRFIPRYGLNIPQHFVNVRDELGLGEGTENLAGELSWLTESDELTITRMIGALEQTGSHEAGWTATWFHDLAGQRLGASGLVAFRDGAARAAYGLSAVIALPATMFALVEGDRQTLYPAAAPPINQGFFYSRLGVEPFQGVIPFFASEVTSLDLTNIHNRTEGYSIGLQWYPRPHFDFEASAGPTLNMATYTFVTTGYVMAHAYL